MFWNLFASLKMHVELQLEKTHTTHTHTHIYLYIYINYTHKLINQAQQIVCGSILAGGLVSINSAS